MKNSINLDVIKLWKLQDKYDSFRKSVRVKIFDFIKLINIELTILDNLTSSKMGTFNIECLDENWLGGKNVFIHACIPDYPSKYSTMGIFLVRIQHDGSYDEGRFIINLEKIKSPKIVAATIYDLLKNAEEKYQFYLDNGYLILEADAREKFSDRLFKK